MQHMWESAPMSSIRRKFSMPPPGILIAGLSLLAFALGADAQQSTPPADATAAGDASQLEEVVVTGTRIAAPNQKSASPIQVVTAQGIQATGRNDISDVLNQLPQIFNNDLGQDLGN